jgi:hypothetical protein
MGVIPFFNLVLIPPPRKGLWAASCGPSNSRGCVKYRRSFDLPGDRRHSPIEGGDAERHLRRLLESPPHPQLWGRSSQPANW